MTKKFKLLKDLPASKAGEIFTNKERGYYYPEKYVVGIDRIDTGEAFLPKYVENNPDWFFEIKEQEWEILKCLAFDGRSIHTYDKKVCLGADKSVKLCKIHSVKRLSDNEVFSIGDEVYIQEYNETGTIACFKLEDSRMIALLRPVLDRNGKLNTYHISYLQKSKPKEEQPFQWSDALIKEMIYQKLPLPNHYAGNVQKCLNEFRASKQQTNTIPSGEKYKKWDIPMNATITHNQSQPKTERIECLLIEYMDKFSSGNTLYRFLVSTPHIPEEKLQLIKQAIEKILNNE